MPSPPDRTLNDLSHREARDAVASGAPVFLPVNPVEYHGPHLSLHNDRLIADGLVRDLHARLAEDRPGWPLLRTADLEVGVDVVNGPGARPVSYDVVSRLVREACGALADLGARRVVLMTFHGSPLHSQALDQGVRLLERRGVRAVAPFNALLGRVIQGEMAPEQRRFEAAFPDAGPELRAALEQTLEFDFHAGLMETSLTLHYAPDTVHPCHRELPPCPRVRPARSMAAASKIAAALGRTALSRELSFAALGLGWHSLRPFPGYTGSPHLASPAIGALLAGIVLELLSPVVKDVLAGRRSSPPPILPWVAPLTLGGRLTTSAITASGTAART